MLKNLCTATQMPVEQWEILTKITQDMEKSERIKELSSIKTKSGDTQVSERAIIEAFRNIFNSLSLSYEEASSQQSKDFRNIGNIGLTIEVKKTDSGMVYFNDTCPEKSIIYCVFYTGKQYKKTPEKNIPPQVLFINGEDFIKDSPWIQEYKRELDSLRDRYARGENKKKLSGLMEVYPRPTYKASIKTFIHNPNATTISTVDPEPEPEPEPVQEEMKAMEDDEKIAIEALLNLR